MSESPATNDLRLLLIDDEEVIHNSVGDFLNKMGYQILHAYKGEEGLKTFAEEGADIVISDIKMPGLDGLDLLREFEQRGADIDVILITGNSDMDTAIEALRRGLLIFSTNRSNCMS